MSPPVTDPGLWEFIGQAWQLYSDEPLFWIIVAVVGIPCILWLYNFFVRQAREAKIATGIYWIWRRFFVPAPGEAPRNNALNIEAIVSHGRLGPIDPWIDYINRVMAVLSLVVALNIAGPEFTGWFSSGWFLWIGSMNLVFVFLVIFFAIRTRQNNNGLRRMIADTLADIRGKKIASGDEEISFDRILTMLKSDLAIGFDKRAFAVAINENLKSDGEWQSYSDCVLGYFVGIDVLSIVNNRYRTTKKGATVLANLEGDSN